MKKHIIVPLLLVAAVSCKKPAVDPVPAPEVKGDYTILAFSAPESKVTYSEGVEHSGIHWEKGETLGLVNAQGNFQSEALTEENRLENGNKALFTIKDMQAGSYLAYHPFSSSNTENSISFTVPSSQSQHYPGFLDNMGERKLPLLSVVRSGESWAYGPITLQDSSSQVEAMFKTVGTVLRFFVYGGESDEYMSALSIEAAGKKLSGTFSCNSVGSLVSFSNNSSKISVALDEHIRVYGDAASVKGLYAIVIPNELAASEEGSVVYKVTTGKGTYSFVSKSAHSWLNGSKYDINLNLEKATYRPGEDPTPPHIDTVDVSDVHIPVYEAYLLGAPSSGSNRAKLDEKLASEAAGAGAERLAQAAKDVVVSGDGLLATFSEAYGRSLSREGDPQLAFLCDMLFAAGLKACPGNYPSSVAATGWAAALMFAQLNYPRQTEILSTGIRIGERAQLSGVSTQSAVAEGRIVGSMLMSALRSNARFAEVLNSLMDSAPKSGSYPDAIADFADGYHWLPVHPEQDMHDAQNYALFADKDRFDWGVSMRDTPRGAQAIKDDTYSSTYMRRSYYPAAMNYQVTADNSITFYNLVNAVFNDMAVTTAKEGFNRERPYDFFGGTTSVEKPSGEGKSYPSGHASAGFATGLLYSEIVPEKADECYRLAYEYGVSRVIVGVHYQSDIEAGFLCGAASLARYHASEGFASSITEAHREYLRVVGRNSDNRNPYVIIDYGEPDNEFE